MEFWRETPGQFQLYFITGVGVMGGDPRHEDSLSYQVKGTFRFGTGINYYFTDDLALDVGMDWTTGRGSLDGAEYIKFAIGLQYNF